MTTTFDSSPELLDRLHKSFYSPGEVAGLASLSGATVLDHIETGRLAAVKLSERAYRIPRKAVIRFLGIDAPEPTLSEGPSRPVAAREDDAASIVATSDLVALTPSELRTRRDRVGDFLDKWGDLRILDEGAAGHRRSLEFALDAPGRELPTEVRARYRESYRRYAGGDWLIASYEYEYVDLARAKRLAHHMHDVGSRSLVAHAHCERATGLSDSEGRQLRAPELDLPDAHKEFMAFYAAGTEADCRGFLPLFVPRTIE